LELLARLVARSSIAAAIGWTLAPWLLVLFAALAALATLDRPSRRGIPGAARLFLVLFAAGLAAQLHFNARLQSDGFYYFAYLRSMTFDGDVEFSNDYKLLGL